MATLRNHYHGPSLFSMGTATADIQIATSSHGLLIDLTSRSFNTTGHANTEHATTFLPIDQAMQLERLLGDALNTAWDMDEDKRQGSLWSDTTFIEPIRPPAPARRRRAASRISAVVGILALFGASTAFAATAADCTAEHPCQARAVPADAPPSIDAALIGAMAQQQQALSAMQSVLVQLLITQQETLTTLRQIQAAQASGGSK